MEKNAQTNGEKILRSLIDKVCDQRNTATAQVDALYELSQKFAKVIVDEYIVPNDYGNLYCIECQKMYPEHTDTCIVKSAEEIRKLTKEHFLENCVKNG